MALNYFHVEKCNYNEDQGINEEFEKCEDERDGYNEGRAWPVETLVLQFQNYCAKFHIT